MNPSQPLAPRGTINGDAFDRYTLLHFGFGCVMGIAGMPAWAASLVSIGWELIERPLKDEFPEAFPVATQDRAMNALVDSGAMMLGWGLAKVGTRWLLNRRRG